jgi:hypothetical protein
MKLNRNFMQVDCFVRLLYCMADYFNFEQTNDGYNAECAQC